MLFFLNLLILAGIKEIFEEKQAAIMKPLEQQGLFLAENMKQKTNF